MFVGSGCIKNLQKLLGLEFQRRSSWVPEKVFLGILPERLPEGLLSWLYKAKVNKSDKKNKAPWHVLENTTLHYLGNVKVALAWKVCKGSYSLESIPSYGKLTCKLVTTWNYSMVMQAWQKQNPPELPCTGRRFWHPSRGTLSLRWWWCRDHS